MYTISWYDGELLAVTGEFKSIKTLIHLFENRRIYFKVSQTYTLLTPRMLCMGEFKYWLGPGDVFNGE